MLFGIIEMLQGKKQGRSAADGGENTASKVAKAMRLTVKTGIARKGSQAQQQQQGIKKRRSRGREM